MNGNNFHRWTALGGLALLLLLAPAGSAFARGWLIPKDAPPLAIKSHNVEVTITDQVAQTHLTQVFVNNTDRRLEATYIFPLPKGAAVDEFSMIINGRKMTGELVESGKARQIYQNIVRQMKDPGLLEYLGSELFRISVFPIEPRSEQTIELTYSETLIADAGLCRYTYPLAAGGAASSVGSFAFKVTLESDSRILNVYSPSHNIDVNQTGDHKRVVGFEAAQALLDRDFVLYYTLSKKDVGISLLAWREKGEDGYFMLLMSPKDEVTKDEIVQRDVTFIMDTSSSMSADGKIDQAKAALKYCVENLNAGDRFNLVRFSTEAEAFQPAPVEFNKENLEKARKFIDGFRAAGGTAIDEALQLALNQKRAGDRPHVVIFLTDGLPTIGERNVDTILAGVERTAGAKTRVFAWGVGNDVNTRLLDLLSAKHGGLTEYVRPQEELEQKLGLFQNKVAYPVLSGVKLEIGGDAGATELMPRELGDLFRGQQAVVLGRFRGKGSVAVTLAGEVNGKAKKIVEEVTFPETSEKASFVARLWAQRRIAYLIDEMQKHGQEKELVDEVLSLSKKFGIMAPGYTSYLVLEDESAWQREGFRNQPQPVPATPAGDRPSAKAPRERRHGGGGSRRVLEPGAESAAAPTAEADDGDGVSGNLGIGGGGAFGRRAPGGGSKAAKSGDSSRWETSEQPARPPALAALPSTTARPAASSAPEMYGPARGHEDAISDVPVGGQGQTGATGLDRREAERLFDESRSRLALESALKEKAGNEGQSGEAAVARSDALNEMKKDTKVAEPEATTIRHVGAQTFYFLDQTWTESTYDAAKSAKPVTVKYMSDAWFRLVELYPDLGAALALGENVLCRLPNGKFVRVGAAGLESNEELEKALK